MNRKPRGRPRSFDTESVLDKTAELFWRKGFDSTSLDDIVAVTGVARPSLAAAFGGKEAMYLLVLRRFSGRIAQIFTQSVLGGKTLSGGLNRYFAQLIDIYTADQQQPGGCMLFSTAIVNAPQYPAIRAELAENTKALDATFESVFKTAQTRGEVDKTKDVALLASLVTAIHLSLSIRARAGLGRSALKTLARKQIAALLET